MMAIPVNLDSVTLVLLRRGPRPAEFTEEELDDLQDRHLAYLDEMRRRGHMAAAGPFSDQLDPSLRGICLTSRTWRRPVAWPRAIPPSELAD